MQVKHCIRPIDTTERRVAIILRRVCDDAPIMKPITDGESLRNYDKKLHVSIEKKCAKMVKMRRNPYTRNFAYEDENDGKENEEREGTAERETRKEKIKEPWRKRPKKRKEKNDGIGTFRLSGDERIQADDDVKWDFGV